MLRHKRNIHAKQTHSEHVKLPGTLDALHPQAQQQQKQQQVVYRHQGAPVQALQLRLDFNQHLNERVTLCLELYHKNIIKKLHELNKINVYKLSKNVSQT